jgi:hypothetical protein
MDVIPVDREAIRAELAATRTAFHEILGGLAAPDWERPTGNPMWTVGDLLHHLVASLELLPREVEHARQGKGMYNLPPFLRDPLSAWFTRWGARRQSLATVAKRHDQAYVAALRTLDGVRDDEWRRGARFWGEGFLDIEGLFRAQARHFAEHGTDISMALSRGRADTPRRAAPSPHS